jgi:hypothetical protein
MKREENTPQHAGEVPQKPLESGANYCSSCFPYPNATQKCLLCISQNKTSAQDPALQN